ncbi:MAG: helix-turn-helix transcriptional regulator [Planctomycetota bacterium]
MLGKELREARQALGLSQEQVGFDAGISRNYVSMLENDKSSPTLDVLFCLCDTLKLSAPRLIQRLDQGRKRKRKRSSRRK